MLLRTCCINSTKAASTVVQPITAPHAAVLYPDLLSLQAGNLANPFVEAEQQEAARSVEPSVFRKPASQAAPGTAAAGQAAPAGAPVSQPAAAGDLKLSQRSPWRSRFENPRLSHMA